MEEPRRNDPASHDRAPSHRKPPMPKAADLAAQLRAGRTLADIAAELQRVPATIATKLSRAGYTSHGEWADPAPQMPVLTPVARAFDDQPWADDASCRTSDPEAFYPKYGESTADAKMVCAPCPVKNQCLEYAVIHDERFGVWGGVSAHQREKDRKTRRNQQATGETA